MLLFCREIERSYIYMARLSAPKNIASLIFETECRITPFENRATMRENHRHLINEHSPAQRDRSDGENRAFLEQKFLWVLAFITIASLIPRLILGESQYISYDGYWHIFIATQDKWKFFWVEIRDNAHPPLFYFLLRFVVRLGRSHLIYRAIGISAGVTSTYVFGLIAAKVCRNQVIALLAAAAYAFALTNIDITIDVRSYPIALLFSLLAFHAYLQYLQAPLASNAAPAIMRFGCFAGLAIMSEYYAIFFLAACLVVPWPRALVDREFRQNLLGSIRRSRVLWAFTLAGLVGLIFLLYMVHLRYLPATENNVRAYYWEPHSGVPVWRFLVENLHREIEYFFPLSISSDKLLVLLLMPTLAAAYQIFFHNKRTSKDAVTAMPPAITLALFCELMILAVAGRYPFGGELRQQSIIAPFLVLTGFVILDQLVGLIRNGMTRGVALTLVVVLIGTNFAYGWHAFPKISKEVNADQYEVFRSMFPNPPVVYSDQLSVLVLFIHNHESDWILEKRYDKESQGTTRGLRHSLYRYVTRDDSGRPLEVVRDQRVWNFDLSNPETYKWIAKSFRIVGVSRAVLFLVPQFGNELKPDLAKAAEDQYRKYANEAGLSYGRSFFDGTAAFIELGMD